MKSVLRHFLVPVVFLLTTCNSVEPPSGLEINLKLEDVSCTETWITLTTTNLQLPTTITLEQNNQTRSTINLDKSDTLLYIDSLLPNQTYKFQSVIQSINHSSNELNVTTLDTTSHDFTWQTWTFGEHSSSVLYDVAIIDENNIWAVGEIYMNDTLGQQDPNAYNAVHWDGTSWQLKRITVDFRGNLITPILEGVFVFSTTDIWFVGSLPIHGNGENWIMYDLRTTLDPNISLSKAWGSGSGDIYFAGRNGSAAHYNGSSWTKIESGTDVNLTDISGTPDGSEVWVCGWNNSDGHTVLLRINNNQSEIIYDSFNPDNNLPYNDFISSLWTNGKLYFWVTGISDGIVKHSLLDKNIAKKEKFGIQYFPYRIRGTELNNISEVGAASMIWHFNGYSWKLYDELLNTNDRLRSVYMKGDIIVATGLRYETILPSALIIIGRK